MTRIAARLMARRAQRVVDERGVTMVLFGLLIVALLIIVAVVIDLGNARQEKRQLQNSADAAALAGANDLGTVNAANACLDAYKFSYNNMRLGTSPGSCPTSSNAGVVTISVTTPYFGGPAAFSAASLVNVRACKDVPTSFARIIGVASIHVCGNATARKIGNFQPCNPASCGTQTSDPDAPCTVDAFTTAGYFDKDSHLQANPPGLKATSDASHSGGTPGGVAAENQWMGATYSSSTDVDLTNHPPTFVLTNTTTGSVVKTVTWDNANAGNNNANKLYMKRMTTINGQDVSGIFAYDVVWQVPGGNANNAAYTVSMTVYDSTSANFPPNGKCGKAQWTFVKGTPPSNGTTTCGENSFIGTISPAPGGVVHPNDTLTVSYQDESVIYNPTDPNDPNRIVFQVDGTDIPQAPLGTAVTQGPNSQAASYGSTTNYTLKSPTSSSTNEKYSTDIQYKVPSTLTSGAHAFHLKAYDSDNNKPGGDCGVADWSLNVSGGASNVELVQ
jgi:Flp pilus assembly protein TadG